eukprot:CAMPEP_0117767162 /NCGR_PEP_ID=MMETSP0947-20121206/21430_1 /TAXON_ID=44440 /ORGANISM="Chattonella subsalsa, Strain CCMP2191" /LENGTH=1052 /DNA_ID=CAMNT_0005590729 /DNA_START=41 /DNA_END=3200 /DNA_ORIENTATION=+
MDKLDCEGWKETCQTYFNALIGICSLLFQREIQCSLKTVVPMMAGILKGQVFDETSLRLLSNIYPEFVTFRHEAGEEIIIILKFFPEKVKQESDAGSAQSGKRKRRRKNDFKRVNMSKLPERIANHKKNFEKALHNFIQDFGTSADLPPRNNEELTKKPQPAIKNEDQAQDTAQAPVSEMIQIKEEIFDESEEAHNTAQTLATESIKVKQESSDNPKEVSTALPTNAVRERQPWPKGKTVTVDNFLEYMQSTEEYKDQLVHVEIIESRQAELSALSEVPLAPEVISAIRQRGIEKLYSHQGTALRAVLQWEQHLVVTTPTSSGKSLIYMGPILNAVVRDPKSRAFLIYPTKALAQDQLISLQSYGNLTFGENSGGTNFQIACYDGDTAMADRKYLRNNCQVLLVNPDILHASVLAGHRDWEPFLRNLKYIVIDEAHSYRGAFGAHVAQVMRRLRRVCTQYNRSPQFICCSATIANPGEHVHNLIGIPENEICVISEDGAPRGKRTFGLWNPALLPEGKRKEWTVKRMPGGAKRRESPYAEAANLLAELVRSGLRSLVFVKVRHVAEHILELARPKLPSTLRTKIASYRGGYTPVQRRELESSLKTGSLVGLIATNALELGIDIGDLDATIHVGYPGTVCSLWQQAGRAGRGARQSLSVLVALDGPLDQRFMAKPQTLFGRALESAVADPHNEVVLKDHLQCAAYEAPFQDNQEVVNWHGDKAAEIISSNSHLFEHSDAGVIFSGSKKNPASGINMRIHSKKKKNEEGINMRSIDSTQYVVTDTNTGKVYETMDQWAAFLRVYEGAIYMHQGQTYVVEDLDLNRHIALVRRKQVQYYTEARDHVRVHILGTRQTLHLPLGEFTTHSTEPTLPCNVKYGPVTVRKQVYGYRHRDKRTTEILEMVDVFLPPTEFQTLAMWLEIPPSVKDHVVSLGRDYDKGGLHAIEHVLISLAPASVMCDQADLSCQHTRRDGDINRDKLLLFETQRGGLGLSEKLMQQFVLLLQTAKEIIQSCNCEDGCLSCIQLGRCGEYNEGLEKDAALDILNLLFPSSGL